MRRTTLAVVLVLIGHSTPARAQLAPKVGVIAGASLTNLNITDPSGSVSGVYHGQVVPGAGATLTSRFFDRFAVRMDLTFLEKGQTISQSVFQIPASLDLNYFEIPLLALVDLKGGSIRPYVVAGPSVGILLGAYIHYAGDSQDTQFSQDVKENFRSDFSLTGGVGIAWLAPKSRVYIETRYLGGQTNIEVLNSTSTITRSLKTRAVLIMIGVTAR
jgi:outer membrane protein with beta-barrel domain